jgi:hypothetical protein
MPVVSQSIMKPMVPVGAITVQAMRRIAIHADHFVGTTAQRRPSDTRFASM